MKLAILALAAMTLLIGCVAETNDGVKPTTYRPGKAHRAGYQYFEESKFNPPGSYTLVNDPADPNSVQQVEKFSFSGKECSDIDCVTNSVRSLIVEHGNSGLGVQPREAWYSWEIYLAPDFPSGPEQSQGGLSFAEFKENNECATINFVQIPGYTDSDLSFTMNLSTGNIDKQFPGKVKECALLFNKKVADTREMRGRWTRFEMFMRWSHGSGGRAMIFVDGKQMVDFTGPTCHSDCLKRNPFQYGIYLSNAPNVEGIIPSTAYFRNVSRSSHREALLGHVE